ncbi:MAG: hypothetical protein WAO12_04840 [Venatoribacter sp.]
MKFWYLLVFTVLSFSVQADESFGLQFPAEDARQAIIENNLEFMGIDLGEEGIELPGLSKSQIAKVQTEYRVRLLNKRWQSFTNIEEQSRMEELLRMRRYANRYNAAMWQGLQKQQMQDLRKYHY